MNKSNKRYVKIASILKSKEAGKDGYIKINDFNSELFMNVKEKDGSSQLYKVKSISLFKPYDNAPDFVEKELVVNLDNEKQVQAVKPE